MTQSPGLVREIRYGRLAARREHARVGVTRRLPHPVTGRRIGDVLVSDSTRVIGNLVLLLVLAALAGAFALVLFSALGRVESRAHWGRAAGIARSRRLERRAFVVGVIMVAAMVAAGLTIYLNRTPPCKGTIVIVTGPNGAPLECLCEQEKRGACFDPGP
jgi:hypothetical protein